VQKSLFTALTGLDLSNVTMPEGELSKQIRTATAANPATVTDLTLGENVKLNPDDAAEIAKLMAKPGAKLDLGKTKIVIGSQIDKILIKALQENPGCEFSIDDPELMTHFNVKTAISPSISPISPTMSPIPGAPITNARRGFGPDDKKGSPTPLDPTGVTH
jgi:hypothetical protein